MSDFILLTDSDDPAVRAAAGQLESWTVEQVDATQLPNAIDQSGVRALLLVTTDPTLQRMATERAHASGIPVVIGCVDVDATSFVLVELNPVIVHARGAVAVDALADEEVLR